MHKLRRDFERFCYRHQNKGIPNLMLVIAIGTALVYLIDMVDPSHTAISYLYFSRDLILRGQIWRLVSYLFLPMNDGILGLAINLYFYYLFGKLIEQSWGTFRFNLYYFSGVVITDIAALLLGIHASSLHINLSLILAYATVFPDVRIRYMYILPLKMKHLAWVYLAITLYHVINSYYPHNLLPVFALVNYFLFFGTDVRYVLPDFLRGKKKGIFYETRKPKSTPIRMKDYRGKTADPTFRHKCTVCGRTDVSDPHLEFRYCSKCSGYYCYCIDHINNHAHIE